MAQEHDPAQAAAADAVARWRLLSSLYEEVDLLDAEAARERLAGLRAEGHPLAEELARMLAARDHAQRGGFMEVLPELPAEPATSAAAEGLVVGPWRLLRRLGAGGMAEVWLARRDDGAFAREVAVKLLHRSAGAGRQAALAQRFARERDILAALDHPNIAPLLDAGVAPDGQPWLALAFVEGAPITAWCEARGWPLRERVRMFRQVLQAVQHAHARLVMHRDLKPDNIFVNDVAQVRLLDFGIAKFADGDGVGRADTELTRAEGRPMTPRYAAPEQLLGQPLTVSCDLYALGVVLYELLAGVHPYAAEGATALKVEAAILESAPLPPSRAARTRERARALAGDLDAVLLQALARRPEDRYASADALLADLDRWLAGEPVLARAPGAWYRARRFAGRHPVGVALGALALTALSATTVAALLAAQQAREESARAVAARDFMVDLFRRADPERARGARISAGELLEAGRRKASEQLRGQPRLQAELLSQIAEVQNDMRQYDGAFDTLAEVQRLQRAAGDTAGVADSALRQAEAAWAAGRFDAAAAAVAEAQAAAPERHAALQARIHLARGELDIVAQRLDQARDHFGAGLLLAGAEGALHFEALRGLALVASLQGRGNESRLLYGRLMSIADITPGLSARNRSLAATDWVEALIGQGLLAEARAVADREHAQCDRGVGVFDEICMRLLLQRLQARLRQEDFTDAGPLLALWARAPVGDAPMDRTRAALHLSRVEAARGDSGALAPWAAHLQDVADGRADPRLASGPWPMRAALVLADLALRTGRPDEAERRAAAVLRRLAPPGEQGGWAYTLLGAARLQLGRPAEALVAFDAAREAYRPMLADDHPRLALYELNRAAALAALGRTAEAASLADNCASVLRVAFGEASPMIKRVDALRQRLRAAAGSEPGRPTWPFFT